MRLHFILLSLVLSGLVVVAGSFWPGALHAFWVIGPLLLLGLHDMLQTRRAVLRNFPIIGHGRYLLELVRPEVNQYFIESNTDGAPFNREQRSVVYQRAKGELDTVPFGTQWNLYGIGYEWMNHSIRPLEVHAEVPRVVFGAETCKHPYSASVLNISAMSYGALSAHAVLALNQGARLGGFAHNTGEGGISPYHLQGGDLVWQLGTAYFGACSAAGVFDPRRFADQAADERIRMIELKLSQGAKPGHGGILPAAKLTPEIAAIRGVPMGQDVLSPAGHSAFRTPLELCEFLARLRELSGGKPVGMKLCIGKRHEFLAVCKAMRQTGLHPDYVLVDGGEGGTGAAPLEFANSVGGPLLESLIFVHNCLVGFQLRRKVRLVASGKIVTGFDLARVLALGADTANSARGMMMALGCIQARRCNSNNCPTGVATQHRGLMKGLVVPHKAERVRNFHAQTLRSLRELLAAAGVTDPQELKPWHILRRVELAVTRHYAELYEYLEPGALLSEPVPESFARAWRRARAETFQGRMDRSGAG